MNSNELWKKFMQTGKICDYLEYRNSIGEEKDVSKFYRTHSSK